jgi:hypothetical protein
VPIYADPSKMNNTTQSFDTLPDLHASHNQQHAFKNFYVATKLYL